MCGTTKNLQVHHIYPRHLYPDREFDPDNLIVLCKDCHLRFGHLGDYRKYNPLIREQAKQIRALLQEAEQAYREAEKRRTRERHI